MLRVSLAILFSLTSSVSYAQDAASCVRIANPDDPLNCFDAAFTEVSEPVSSVEGAWNVRIESSQLDDSRSVYMRVTSEQPVLGRFGSMENGTLMVRCLENTTSLFIIFGGHFMADIQGRGRVDYRIDAATPRNISMAVSNDNNALGLWRGNQAIPFIRSLFGADNLLVRATPFSESAVEMNFDISGLEEQIAPLREACNW